MEKEGRTSHALREGGTYGGRSGIPNNVEFEWETNVRSSYSRGVRYIIALRETAFGLLTARFVPRNYTRRGYPA